MYLELKTGYADNGPAWVSIVDFSKSGQTIYFNNKALKKGNVTGGNYFDVETGDEYWISGVKKNGADRHWSGTGKIMVERRAVPEYLAIINSPHLETKKYSIVDIPPTDKSRFTETENQELN